MTDKTRQDSGSTHIIRYALELGLLWIDGDGRDKVREALDALDILEAELEAVGAGGVQALSAAPAVPNGDELRRIARSARTSASDDASPTEYVLAGWKAAMLAASPTPPAEQQAAPKAAPQQEAREPVSPRHPVVMQWRDNAIEACAKIADAYGHEHAAQDMRAMLTAPQQEAQEPPVFSTMLRKMWSGREVQQWINENWPRNTAPQPAPVRDYPPLPKPDCPNIWGGAYSKNQMHAYVDADRTDYAPASSQPAPAELERLRERISRMGLDVDRAMRGHVNEQSPLGTTRLAAIAALAKPAPAPLSERTDAEIVAQTVELTKYLMSWKWGLEPECDASRIWESKNTKAQVCWNAACHIQDLLTQTDVWNAVTEVDGAALAAQGDKV